MPAGPSSMTTRSRLRVAYDVGHRLAQHPGQQRPVARVGVGDGTLDGRGDAGVSQHAGRCRELGLEVAGAQAADRRPHLGQRLACGGLDRLQLLLGARGVDVDQPGGELGLDRERGQRVTEDVVDVAGHPLPLDDHGVVAEGGVRQVLTLAEEPQHHAADHDRPEHEEEEGRKAVDVQQRQQRKGCPDAHGPLPGRARQLERGEDCEVGREGDDPDADHRHGGQGQDEHRAQGPPRAEAGGVAEHVGHREPGDAEQRADLRRDPHVGLDDRDDGEGEEDQPDRGEGPPPLLPGVVGQRRRGHVRARLRRTPHSATSAKITVHASTLATGSHSASRPPTGSHPSVSGKRASAT